MASATVGKTAEELRKEIAELQRQQWEITERLRDPRGIRRSGPSAGPSGPRKRVSSVRPAVALEDQPALKRRLSSAVVKLDGEETKEDASGLNDIKEDVVPEPGVAPIGENSMPRPNQQNNSGFRRESRDGNPRMRKMDYDVLPTEPVPRVLPKDEDPSLVKRNRRMLGQLLGTLEKFREEDKQFTNTEAYMRRSDSLRRAEEKAREESERLRQQEREQIAEKRRRDLTLRARVAAKAEQKKMELLFIHWSEHHKKLSNFLSALILERSDAEIHHEDNGLKGLTLFHLKSHLQESCFLTQPMGFLFRSSNKNLEEWSLNRNLNLLRSSWHQIISELKSQNLSGELPFEIANLTQLIFLDLSRNCLHGSIPAAWASLPLKNLS